jgi:hypothetical protein
MAIAEWKIYIYAQIYWRNDCSFLELATWIYVEWLFEHRILCQFFCRFASPHLFKKNIRCANTVYWRSNNWEKHICLALPIVKVIANKFWQVETEIGFLQGNDTFKMKITFDRHGPRRMLNDVIFIFRYHQPLKDETRRNWKSNRPIYVYSDTRYFNH